MTGMCDLLDAWKTRKGIETDMAAADRLNVGRAAVSKWRKGSGWPSAPTLARMCRDTGEDYAQWTMIMDCDRAPNDAARESIQRALRILKKYGRAAAIVMAVAGTNTPLNAHKASHDAGMQAFNGLSTYTLCELQESPNDTGAGWLWT